MEQGLLLNYILCTLCIHTPCNVIIYAQRNMKMEILTHIVEMTYTNKYFILYIQRNMKMEILTHVVEMTHTNKILYSPIS